MDQTQDQLDPEIAQEVITLLNRKITNLRVENAQLQNQLSRASVKTEDEDRRAVSDDHTKYLQEEITHLRSELEQRPDPGEVSVLEEKLKKRKRRREELERNLRSQVEQLRAELDEAESGRQNGQAAQEALRKEIQKLCDDLNERTREKEEALAQLESQQLNTFDVHKFLRGELKALPLKPDPVVITGEGIPRTKGVVVAKRNHKYILSVNGPNTIKWANEGGGCVVPCPPVVYDGGRHVVERACKGIIENGSYELFGVDGGCTYYGTYRCIKVTTMDWDKLKSLGQEFTRAFLGTTIIHDGLAAPVIRSLIKNMYKTGILMAGCAVLRCESFNEVIVKELQTADGPRIRNVLINNSRKRPRDGHKNGEGSRSARKRSKIYGGGVRTRASRPG